MNKKIPTAQLIFIAGVSIIFVLCPNFIVAQDIFTPPASRPTSVPYPTSAALMAATKSGEIPEKIVNWADPLTNQVGRSLIVILHNQYGIAPNEFRNQTYVTCGLLLANITGWELKHDKDAFNAYSANRRSLSEECPAKFMEAMDSIAKEYAKSVKEYVALKTDREDQRQAADAQRVRDQKATDEQADEARRIKQATAKAHDDAIGKQAEQERMQNKTIADARVASINEADKIQADAKTSAMQAMAAEHKQKLNEVLASPAYKLWRVSLEIQAAEQIIQKAQEALDHDDAVSNESGVTDLTARRHAGEMMVAGKKLADNSFAAYKQLGGSAKDPSEVVPGPDPAEAYR